MIIIINVSIGMISPFPICLRLWVDKGYISLFSWMEKDPLSTSREESSMLQCLPNYLS